ncbi:hypothetical protein D3C84_897780 [compost metagenome]
MQEGLIELDESATKKYGYSFIKITNTQKKELLTIIDREAKEYQQHKEEKAPTHYFTMIKQLTLFGFFTSEAGATQVLRYNPVPGKYEGCIPYIKGEKSWS